MSMGAEDWRNMASVYQAGADSQRRYSQNVERRQQAEALEAMAERCEELAAWSEMDGEALEEAERAYRQRHVPQGSRLQCRAFVVSPPGGGSSALCTLHREHVLDWTDHASKEKNVTWPLDYETGSRRS